MTELLILIVVTSIWVLGVKISTYKGMVFQRFGAYAKERVKNGDIIFEAIVTCAWCMPSIHTVVGYAYGLFVFGMEWRVLFMYPIVIMGASVASGITWTLIEYLIKNLEHIINIERLSHYEVRDRQDEYHKRKSLNNKNYQNGKVKKQPFQHEG